MEFKLVKELKNQSAMRHVLLVVALLFFQIRNVASSPEPAETSEPSQKHGSHNLLNKAGTRNARCVPCEQSLGGPTFESRGGDRLLERGPISNSLNPDYRGNGADNLGYDWSPMAWGGLAYPQKSRSLMMSMMRGRGGRQMIMGKGPWNDRPGNVHVICDTCRTYWTDGGGSGGSGRSGGFDEPAGRQFPGPGAPNFHGGPSGGRWYGGREGPADYEARVRSPTVGVLVKPGSQIAYIPSVSGDMFWDGKSAGGTRWDGFSNGISWVMSGSPGWDGPGPSGRESKPGSYPGNDFHHRPWDGQKGFSAWDSTGKGYYFANGYPNQDRGYASNWQYGSTNQHGWNGHSMKWNYGSKNWDDNDRSANRFYFNSPEDRSYGPRGGIHQQYGNQYPNYEPSNGYRGGYGPAYRPTQGVRVNDRDPPNFPSQENRPWDYNSVNRFGDRWPSSRPDWRPDSHYPGSHEKDSHGKYPTPGKYPVDKIDYDKPWAGRPGYGGKPESGSGSRYPFGGNRFPGSDDGGRPNGGNLFYPNEGHQDSGGGSSGGSSQPDYGTSSRPGGYPSTGNQSGGSYPSGGHHGASNQSGGYPAGSGGSYPSGGRPSSGNQIGGYPGGSSGGSGPQTVGGNVIYIGSRPSGGNGGGYSGGSSGFPGGSSYPGGDSRPGGYPDSGGGYPKPGNRPGHGYGGGHRPDDGYPSHGSGHPSDSSRPGGSYYGSVRPIDHGGSSGYPSGGRPSFGSSYPGDRPGGYPSGGSGYQGGFPDDRYPNMHSSYGGRPDRYPSPGDHDVSHGSGYGYNYPTYGLGGYPQGGRRGYYTGIITELGPDNRPYHGPGGQSIHYGSGGQSNYYGSTYPDKNGYSGGSRYPFGGNKYSGGSDRYPSGGDGYLGGGGGYPSGGGGYPSGGGGYPSGGGGYGGGGGGYPGGSGYSNGGGYSSGRDRFYYGQDMDKGQYPDGYPSSGNGADQNHGSTHDKNSWNYGDKDSIYRRSGGSYPPYRGGPYYTSSYLDSASTTSTQDSEAKTTVTKADVVTQPTPES